MAFLVVNGIRLTYAERPGSPEESFASQTGRVRRTFDVPWPQRWTFCQAMLGWSEFVQTAPGYGYISRTPPQAYDAIGRIATGENGQGFQPWLYASSIERMEGVGLPGQGAGVNDVGSLGVSPAANGGLELFDDNNIFQYAFARITVGYEALPYRVVSDEEMAEGVVVATGQKVSGRYNANDTHGRGGHPDESTLLRYVSRHIQPTAENLRLPGGQMFFVSTDFGTRPPAVNGGNLIIPSAEVQYIWHQVPAVPSAVYKQVGSVNDNTFADGAPGVDGIHTFAAGTLLLVAAEVKTYRGIGGVYYSDVVYRMKYFAPGNIPGITVQDASSGGHNYLLRWLGNTSASYRYELVTTDGQTSSQKLYPSSDFTQLFTLP